MGDDLNRLESSAIYVCPDCRIGYVGIASVGIASFCSGEGPTHPPARMERFYLSSSQPPTDPMLTSDLARAQGLAEALRDRTFSAAGEDVTGVAAEVVTLLESARSKLSRGTG